MKLIDKTGKRYGRLIVLSVGGHTKWAQPQRLWLCKCDCGNTVEVAGGELGRRTNSCGCLKAEINIRHGATEHPSRKYIYRTWVRIRVRCYYKKYHNWAAYGGRGITVSEDWMTFENFERDMGPTYQRGLQIDRIDNSKGYSKENCRWATSKQNNRNRRSNTVFTIRGETKTLVEWCEVANVGPKGVFYRLGQGWDPERAIFTPSQRALA
jgi:hypothetical protein